MWDGAAAGVGSGRAWVREQPVLQRTTLVGAVDGVGRKAIGPGGGTRSFVQAYTVVLVQE